MFARKLSLTLKPDVFSEFSKALEKEVMPVLKRQAGFQGEIMLGGDGSLRLSVISLWDTKEQADAYEVAIYPGIVQSLDRFFDAPPKVRVTSATSRTLRYESSAKAPLAAKTAVQAVM